MKKLLLSTVALAALTGGAFAADLPARAAPPPMMAAVPVFTWTGFYAGFNVGGAFTDNENGRGRIVTSAPGGAPVRVTPAAGNSFFRGGEDGGFTGGGQVGYNMQFGSFVAGLEADAQFIDLGESGGLVRGRRTANVIPGAIAAPVGVNAGNVFFRGNGVSELDFFGTVRGRLGFAFDRTLVYATGGFAYSFVDDEKNEGLGNTPFFVRGNGRNLRDRNADDRYGFTVGGGVEYAFTNNISLKIEGLYVDLSEDGNGGRNVGVTNLNRPIRLAGKNESNYGEFALVRAGLNFRFGTW